MGFGAAIPTPPSPGVGGGAANAQIQVPGYNGSGVDQMNKAFGNMISGIEIRNNMLAKNKELAQQQSQFDQNQIMKEKEFNLDSAYKTESLNIEREKVANLQKQQAITAQRDLEKADRERMKGEMDLIDWKNKQQAQEVLMNNLPIVDKLLNDGTADEKIYNSPEYKQTLAALSLVDPHSASTFFADAQKRKYETAKDKRESASYSVIAPIYTEGFPQVMEAILAGKPITTAIAPVKTKLDQLYGTGQISPAVYKQTLKDYIDLTQDSLKKLNGAANDRYTTYDAQGNVTTDPSKVARQVSAKTGKVSTVGGQPDMLAEFLGVDTEPVEPVKKEDEKKDDFWSSMWGGND